MQNKEVVDQKIGQLDKLMKTPWGNKGGVLKILHDIFQLTHEGRDLSPDQDERLNKAACLLLSPELRAVLVKLHLDVYGFHFAALSFTHIDDVVDDLSNNGEILKGIHVFPLGAVNKLKRELLGPHQQNSLNKSSMVSPVATPPLTKKINKEQLPHQDKMEENSPLSSIVNFPSPNKRKIVAESPKKTSKINQLSTTITGRKDTSGKADDASNMMTNFESTGLPLKKRKLGNEIDSPSTSRPQHSAPVVNLPLNIPIEKRFAEKLRDRCQSVGKHSSGMQLYAIPLTKKPATRSSQAERYVFSEGRRSKFKVESKTILLMGATGSGKTTLINSMVNYILGVEFEDPFRFVLIKEEGTSSSPVDQAESQTSKVTAYELHYQVGFRIPFTLIIVDTPGYGDTKGIERDREITDSIEQFFKDKKGIQELDAVGFTVQAALARLTPTQKYIFESILAIFGNDVKDNISFLVTFTDGRLPPVLDAIKAANIAHQLDTHGQPRHHRFNNSGFFSSNQDEEDTLSSTFWKMGIKSFDAFFPSLFTMKTRSLTLSTEVLEERKRIHFSVQGLTLKIRMQLNKMEELRKTKQVIENHKDQIKTNHELIITITDTRGTKITITDGKGTTNCSKCSMTCHFPCTCVPITDDKRKCSVMDKDGLCTTCPLKCKWDLHSNQNYHWEYQDIDATRRYSEILEKYEEALQRKLTTEGVLHALESELEQIKYDLKSDINTITAHLKRLDQIALRPDAFTTTDYIELMIHSEKKEKKLGFQERISNLESMLENAMMVNKIRAGESVLPEAGASADQSRFRSIYLAKGILKRAKQYTFSAKDEFSPQDPLSSGKKYLTRQQSSKTKADSFSNS